MRTQQELEYNPAGNNAFVHLIMVHTSDFSWLPLSVRKCVDMPTVVYEQDVGQNYGGYYIADTSTIVVVDNSNVASAIAHEYRHHLQYLQGTLKPSLCNGLVLFERYRYNKAINLYFNTQWHELDALMFEYYYAKSRVNKFWVEALVTVRHVDESLEM